MKSKRLILGPLLIAASLYAEDVMIERMQSVVDEVSELRKRYEAAVKENEACVAQVKEQNLLLGSKSGDKKDQTPYIKQLELENSRLKQAHTNVKKELKELDSLQRELESLKNENERLNSSAQILVQKNQSLLSQLNKLKRNKTPGNTSGNEDQRIRSLERSLKEEESTSKALKARNQTLEAEVLTLQTALKDAKSAQAGISSALTASLQKALEQCEQKKVKSSYKVPRSCPDDNPFPKLLMKDEQKKSPAEIDPKAEHGKKTAVKVSKNTEAPLIIEETGSTYRVRQESQVFDAPNGSVIEIWEDKTSFTSNISKGEWIRITGYFVERKWRKADEAMWVQRSNAVLR